MTIEQFLLNVFFAALSALFGVGMGLWYSRRQFSELMLAEKKELSRKLIKAFRFNLERVKQMEEQLTSQQKQEIPDYRLDTESVAHILFHGRELFHDESWFERFNWQRFQLAHINAKVDFLNDLTNLSGISSGSIFAQGGVGHGRYVSLVGHLKVSHKEISAMIADYEKVPS